MLTQPKTLASDHSDKLKTNATKNVNKFLNSFKKRKPKVKLRETKSKFTALKTLKKFME